jgi:hypothetical protein
MVWADMLSSARILAGGICYRNPAPLNGLESGHLGPMAISEDARHDLYNALTQAIGPGPTEIFMSVVPLHDLDQVATKGDLAVTAAELRAEMADLRGDMADLRAELKTDIAELRAELKSDIAALRRSMTNWMLTLLVAVVGAMASIGFATAGS